MMDRRGFVGAVVALPFALRGVARAAAEKTPRWILLGTDKGKGIYRAPWNAATGELGKVELALETERPDFFAMHPKLPVMYSVNSVGEGKGAVSSFAVDAKTGGLKLMNQQNSNGDGPCYVSLDATGRAAYLANYTGGSVTGYALAADGSIEAPEGTFGCKGVAACGTLGPVKDRQESAHMHCTVISPDNRFVLVCDLANDAIDVFPMELGKKVPYGGPIRVQARVGSGPRHVAFHPSGKWVYCIHELDCTIDVYSWSVVGGKAVMKLVEGSTISTLAPGSSLTGNTGCEIVIGDSGKFAYACSRGVDEITVYRVDAATGKLTEQQRVKSGGLVPRLIAFDPSRRWLVSCNQGSAANPVGNVAVFSHDAKTGRLSDTPKIYAAETPMCAVWV